MLKSGGGVGHGLGEGADRCGQDKSGVVSLGPHSVCSRCGGRRVGLYVGILN